MEQKLLDRKSLEEDGKKYGLENITEEEYQKNCRFTLKTALTRILNERKGTAQGLKKDRKLLKGILLGGRDFVYKGITVDESKSQFITVLLKEPNSGEPCLIEHTIWGHLKPDSIKHGMGVEMEVEESSSTNEDGREFHNRNIRKVSVKKPEQATLKELLTELHPRKSDEISEDDLYNTVVVEGEISNVEPVPIFDEGQITDENPLIVNGKPCVRLGLRTEGDVKVSVQFDPARLSEPMLSYPDFMEVLKPNDIESAINSLVTRKIVGIGTVRRFQVGEPSFVTINLTALFVIDEPEAKPYDFPKEKETDDAAKTKSAKKGSKAPATPSSPAPPAPPSTQKVTAPAPPKEEAKAPDTQVVNKVASIKAEVKDALSILGDDTTVADIRELKPSLKDVKEALLEAILKSVKTEKK